MYEELKQVRPDVDLQALRALQFSLASTLRRAQDAASRACDANERDLLTTGTAYLSGQVELARHCMEEAARISSQICSSLMG